ncbi:MAG: gliding motility-associated protein GldE [Crocinitomicaceae bacterium]|nr:gliding motility-associated protein GldE [Flavobacteriales bacterium]NQZ38015.1 gliding motility-associated protein GldE [Crocinitomicaceae bacterium]
MTSSDPLSIQPLVLDQVSSSGAQLAEFSTTGLVISCIVLMILLLISALISGSEAAFFSLSPADKEEVKNDQSKKASFVNKMLSRPKELLATILIINNFINVGIVILSSSIYGSIAPVSENNKVSHFLIEVTVITLILLLLGEVIPKIYATKNALGFSKMMARALYYLNRIPPISWIRAMLVRGSSFIQKTAGNGKVRIFSGELEQALALTKDDASEDKQRILEGIVKFGGTDVRQIMRSRMDVYAIDIDSPFEELMEMILECGHSRIPVYEKTFDQIQGVLFIKDLLPFLGKAKTDWKTLIRKPFFVPENKKIDDLLKEFQEKKFHIAMVVDEYGGTSGIVTLEDILEEIVGDITDEFDDDELIYTKIDDNTYLFEGKTSLVDFYKVMNIDEKDSEVYMSIADSLGGFITENAGRILASNEFVVAGNLKLIVESSDKKRVKMVKVIKQETQTEK